MPDGDANVEQKPKSWLRRIASHVVDMLIPEDDTTRERGRWIERKLQSFMLTLMTLAVVWAAGKIASIDTIVQQISTMRVQLDGTYRADVAQRDMQDLRQRIDAGDLRDQEYDKRLDSVERRMDRVEYVLDSAPGTQRLIRRAQAADALDSVERKP